MNHIFKAEMIGWTELLPIIAILLLLFAGKKIPELMKGLGKGVKEFKDAMNGEAKTEKVVDVTPQNNEK